ncbi:radical SAM protein [Tissierella pigra]|uniref:Radical SAM protein n=1 Tax=Tissierella pigra TaxID=2607614 RepID=A0A6N7Y3T6_9FIRM|nr:radical SAM protein [Tissierella pigra]MSU03128.1 radical SAM protein [Tissierella pigra]
MIRYSRILEKNPREIVLLKSRPCTWARCFFCDYIHDNCKDDTSIIQFNKEILKDITGNFKKLEVINSASVFELPKECLQDIKDIVYGKDIKELYFESHYMYKNRLQEIRDFFPDIDVKFKSGIETFHNEFRNNYLKKGVNFNSPQEVAAHFDSICLLVGIKGQTKGMVSQDIDLLLKYFKRGCINIYMENSTPVKADLELISWFKKEYSYLKDMDNIEILWNNTDFGVGEKDEY